MEKQQRYALSMLLKSFAPKVAPHVQQLLGALNLGLTPDILKSVSGDLSDASADQIQSADWWKANAKTTFKSILESAEGKNLKGISSGSLLGSIFRMQIQANRIKNKAGYPSAESLVPVMVVAALRDPSHDMLDLTSDGMLKEAECGEMKVNWQSLIEIIFSENLLNLSETQEDLILGLIQEIMPKVYDYKF